MKKILFFTGKRGGFNHFTPIIEKLKKRYKISIIYSDMHTNKYFGNTHKQHQLNFVNNILIKTIQNAERDTKINRAKQIPEGMNKNIEILKKLKPDIVLIIGDRAELFTIAIPAVILNIPILHLYGGDISKGSYDNLFRYSLSFLSSFHLVSNEKSRKNLLKIGIDPNNIFNFGLIALNKINYFKKVNVSDYLKKLKLSSKKKNIIVIFHPETIKKTNTKIQIKCILNSLKKIDDNIIFIYPCSDPGYKIIVNEIKKFLKIKKNSVLLKNIQSNLFYNLFKYSDLIMGNSSAGILESKFFQTPSLNIGNRQDGRLYENNTIHSTFNTKEILKKINYALNDKKFLSRAKNSKSIYFKKSSLEKTSELIKKIINKKILPKPFKLG